MSPRKIVVLILAVLALWVGAVWEFHSLLLGQQRVCTKWVPVSDSREYVCRRYQWVWIYTPIYSK